MNRKLTSLVGSGVGGLLLGWLAAAFAQTAVPSDRNGIRSHPSSRQNVLPSISKIDASDLQGALRLEVGIDMQLSAYRDLALRDAFGKMLAEDAGAACDWLASGALAYGPLWMEFCSMAAQKAPLSCLSASCNSKERIGRVEMVRLALGSVKFTDAAEAKDLLVSTLGAAGPDLATLLKEWGGYFKTKQSDYALDIAKNLETGAIRTALVESACVGLAASNPKQALEALSLVKYPVASLVAINASVSKLLETDFSVATQYLEASPFAPYILRSLMSRFGQLPDDAKASLLTWAPTRDEASNHFATCALIGGVEGVTTEGGQQLLNNLAFDRAAAQSAVDLMIKTGDFQSWGEWIKQRGGLPNQVVQDLMVRLQHSRPQETKEWLRQQGAASVEELIKTISQPQP